MTGSANGKVLASGGEDGTVCLQEGPTGRPLGRWKASEFAISALAFSPDSRLLVSGNVNGVLNVWNLHSIRKELAALGVTW